MNEEALTELVHAAPDFGTALRALRFGADYTLDALASAAGITVAYLSMIERGDRNPPSAKRIGTILTILQASSQQGAMLRLAKASKRRLSMSLVDAGPLKRRLLNEIARLSEEDFIFEDHQDACDATQALLMVLRRY